jgi:exodeoxyribonuclease VII large subunit
MSQISGAVRNQVGSVWVEGEISNLTIPASGHVYFTLKDAGAQISCVLFRMRAAACRIRLRDGLKVRVYGEATIYEKRGQVQLNLSIVEQAGLGELQLRFLELKNRLEAEGLFDPSRKKPIPSFPTAVGLVTSATGAAIQDMRHIFEKRAPWIDVYLLPVPVQGEGAELKIAAAIKAWGHAPQNGLPAIDVLIVGRGGGSIEDLWNFNEEVVARAIAACPIPVISGVGHETDFTIADFVADQRAPTPTAAAVLASPDGPAIDQWLDQCQQSLRFRADRLLKQSDLRLQIYERGRLSSPDLLIAPYEQTVDRLEDELLTAARNHLAQLDRKLESLELRIQAHHPRRLNEQRQLQLNALAEQLMRAARQKLTLCDAKIAQLETQLNAAGPAQTLKRGYALVRTSQGRLLRSANEVHSGDELHITVAQGSVDAQVLKTEPPTPSN